MNNRKWILKEALRINAIENELDKKTQQDKLDEIIEKINELDCLEYERQYCIMQQDIKSRGIEICDSPVSSTKLKQKWREVFLSKLNKQEQKKIYINQFLWHGFSYEKINCISKGKARRALINHKKNEVFVFYQHKEAAYIYKNASKIKASDFDMDDDVYVVDKDFQWTYVKTHEKMCGPYFTKSK
ncbi:hypothetical protein CS063_09185 [Sporanaerobium hydrogeniformans]|uniref:Uncharacterized protein n=1 Tax=Sporanaerobium hydrogeniformans TaxID=3072179 RepID=A0AC61DBK2_9FIRM|nr:DUF4275 family protein [Sporanaerobium hydrogeniformans]PHV70694.1 hypothetical protein CS063_09185 [Sporanaerobium hydrogeniformans]